VEVGSRTTRILSEQKTRIEFPTGKQFSTEEKSQEMDAFQPTDYFYFLFYFTEKSSIYYSNEEFTTDG
jgi:hypothetical protein